MPPKERKRPAKRPAAKPASRRLAGAKKAKTYRLSETKIAAAKEILNAPTATAAIETALDMVVFRKELVEGTVAMLGVTIVAYDDRGKGRR